MLGLIIINNTRSKRVNENITTLCTFQEKNTCISVYIQISMFVDVLVIEILEFNWKKIKNKNRAKREPGNEASKTLSRAQPHHPPARVGGEAGH